MKDELSETAPLATAECAKYITRRQTGFLVWLYRTYGLCAQDTLKVMAAKTGRISYVSVRNNLTALAEAGYLAIENRGKSNQIYHLNKEKLKQYVND